MVDLHRQYLDIEKEVDESIKSVITDSAFINGPSVTRFAENLKSYLHAEVVVPCANGTDALQVAMMALGFKPGDEVIVPAFTYVATVEVIALLGLTPVFVDVDPDTFNIDPQDLEKAINERTVGLVVVHLFGQCANMDAIMKIAHRYEIKVIEDNAQAIGSEYTFANGETVKSGLIGDVGTTSFFPSKNLGCYGDGGALTVNNAPLGETIRMICNHGQKRKYYHDIIGINSRLDTLQAAILNVKLEHLDQYSASRNKIAEKYDRALSDVEGIQIPVRNASSTHVFHQYTLKVTSGRDELKQCLNDNGVPSMIYYPVPQHLQQAYLPYGGKVGDHPVSEMLCTQVLSLPIHTHMDDEQTDHIVEVIKRWSNG